MDVGERIKSARIALGLTQEELGEMLGVQKSAISKYEKGRVANIKRSTLKRLSEILQIKPSDLIGDFDSQVNVGHSDAKSELTASEIELLQCFRACNSTGQELILGTARACAGNPDMQKSITKSSKTAG